MPNRARRSGFAKKIEVVHWTGGGFSTTGLAAGTVALTVLPAQHLPETLLRIRGRWSSSLNAAQAPGVGVFLDVGMILVPEGTGTTVLWSPGTDGDAPWIWWDTMAFLYTEYVTDVIGSQITAAMTAVIDSKAMRKVRNQELQFVAENTTMSGLSAGTVVFGGDVRVLAGS